MLRKIQSRAPLLNCFGLHEWAMLYQKLPEGGDAATELSQFQQLPLRVTPATIAAVVQTKSLRCTHFDAFRFFTADAVPLNSVSPPPSRAAVAQNDQPGCVHVTMDLFKCVVLILTCPFVCFGGITCHVVYCLTFMLLFTHTHTHTHTRAGGQLKYFPFARQNCCTTLCSWPLLLVKWTCAPRPTT